MLFAVITILASNPPALRPPNRQPLTDPDQVLADIKTQASTIKTLVVQFNQERISRLLRKPLISEGLIYFERDGKMLTRVNSPAALQLLMEDQYVTVVNPELGVVKKRRLSRSDQMIKMWLDGEASIEKIKQHYDLRLTKLVNLNRYRLAMAPKEEKIARHIAVVEIEINTGTLLPEQIIIQNNKTRPHLAAVTFYLDQ